ncbi:MBL fold metallo-hydrolase [Nocardia sp. alder85J]|uniref:MBL fold metallo-hydrolase n=1 Tax=Nocardia sp. alder85J TaxID=2862949 RepID=UPI001CD6597A|nr:MBL fold metallo-hydrolase [Nocardia sp. alder85J]MCX4095668.1 MBL fold metallo-hydrolase [Nocardia sp. alder85J]
MRLGAIELDPVYDGIGRENAREVLCRKGFDGDPWDENSGLLDTEGNLELAVGGYLLRTSDRTILVDAGVGSIDNGRYRGGELLNSLAGYGIEPGDVTDVIFTHLHFDHVGWATRKGNIVFENATYRVHRLDWEHFVESSDAEPGAKRKLNPVVPRLELFDSDVTIAPGVVARHFPGHTPGTTVFIVSSEGRTAALVGDLAHTPLEFTQPDWEFFFDFSRDRARASRSDFVSEFSDTGTAVFAAHFPDLRPGYLTTRDGRTEWTYEKKETF